MIDGMDAAQAHHDRAEPPESETCQFCDGQGAVTVNEIRDAGGQPYYFRDTTEPPSVPCPVCKLDMVFNGSRLE